MLKIKYLLLLLLLFITSINYGQFTDVINSNRPGLSMGGFSVGKTVFQAELGLYGYDESHDTQNYEAQGIGSDLSLRYGAFLEQLEFILQTQFQQEWYQANLVDNSTSGFSQIIVGAKYMVYDPLKKQDKTKPNLYSWNANHKFNWKQFIPAVAVYAAANFNVAGDNFARPGIPEDPSISPKAMIITQNQLGRYVLVINIIGDKIGSDVQSIDYVVTLTRGINQRWSAFLESNGYNGDYYSDAFIRGGAAYLLKENIQIDASLSTNFKSTPSIFGGGIGLSWRFDKNYQEVMTRVPKDEEEKDKDKKKDKKKDKSKKRLDEVEVEKTN